MKKRIALMLVMMLSAAVFVMTACSSSDFACVSNDDNTVTVTAENAGDDMEALSGGLEVADGEEIKVESALESGEIQLEFFPAGEASAEDDPEEIEGEAVFKTLVKPEESFQAGVAAGSYNVKCTVTDKATGTIEISVVPGENTASGWETAESTEDAGEKAGVGLFLCDPQGTSLGAVTNADYHYQEGVAEAHYGLAAVSVTVHKGLKTVNDGDVSFDTNSYANEWTWNIDGTEVKCFGNREGEATKSIWTTDEYAYSITAYGEGGDDDYGLSQEDFTTIFKDLQ